jgi:hypothetical protein
MDNSIRPMMGILILISRMMVTLTIRPGMPISMIVILKGMQRAVGMEIFLTG